MLDVLGSDIRLQQIFWDDLVQLNGTISFEHNPVTLGAAAILIAVVLISFPPGAVPGSG